jgi:hypothetical protein
VGNAIGISMFVHLCIRETPDIVPASCSESGTLFNPQTVYRVAGTVPYIIAAIKTDVSVILNRNITGIKYTKEGKVSKKSQTDKIN